MASDFVQEGQKVGLPDQGEEKVKPGALPGVLIGSSRVWRDGREMITSVETVFPPGSVEAMSGQERPGLGLGARCWLAASSMTMSVVGLGAKIILRGLNTTRIHGRQHLDRIFDGGYHRPVISVMNHDSCFDDPGVWGAVLSTSQLADTRNMRWGASASEVIFINRPLETFWKLGKVIPIVRGWGVDQPAMRFLQARLDSGGWVNIFPEGRVTLGEAVGPLRWGVGRLVWNSLTCPVILPVIHLGMNTILPNPRSEEEKQSYIMRPGNLVTVNIGPPLDLGTMLRDLREAGTEAAEARKAITGRVERVMASLYEETRELHRQNIVQWLARWHDGLDITASILT